MANPLVNSRDVPRILSLLLAYYKAERYLHQALASIADSEPKYARAFRAASDNINRNGVSLRDALKEEQVFDENIIEILQAGQNAGELTQVIADVIRATKQQNAMINEVYKSIVYQAILLVSVIIISPYLLFNVATATPKGSSVRNVADIIKIVMDTLPLIELWYPAAVLSCVIYVVTAKHVRSSLLAFFSSLPYVSNAIVNYQSGQWCNYASLMFKAGLNINDIESMLKPMLITPLQEAFSKMFSVAIDKGWGEALTLTSKDDPRNIIPVEARSFIRSGGLSGQLETQLRESADFLNERSTEQFAVITKFVGVFVMALVGAAVLALAMQVYLKGGAI